MTAAPIVLVPGFWLGAWAWDEVVERLRGEGLEVSALTLPGLGSADEDRARIRLSDHVDAIVAAVEAAGSPVVLAVHSGAAAPGYGVTDQIPERIAAMVYVDTGPPTGPLDAGFEGVELPLPPREQLAAEENLDGLTDEHLERFEERAVPQPGAALREAPPRTNPARLEIPTTVVCSAYDADAYRGAVAEGQGWLGGLAELHDVTYVDLPTSHWPMWSRPDELADIIADVARQAGD